ncbi:coiled-coil domain-containing protein [Microbulbifer thermotolerans]|uniref:hypothetical protein n=1 Tax=Microbulbifer thermotolerans TaxID=252514 RepID=UPI000A684467|nr:hypothetical protein [Microbulbifer thermotolerans]MCX2794578.1 hypothetical protein [Microbulbifer thermotolerans]MCX2831667.1 hypothetical protein [Microbulbifer thermotolerans]MCX2833926.1 hypothetical protein [Microbulbifer thermotolerans]
MAVTRYRSLLLAGLLALGSAVAVAQTQASLTAEQNRLARMEQSLENRRVEVEDIENELLSYEYKLEKAREALDKAQQKFEESRRELQQAELAHQQQANSDTERALNKAKHAFAMAERGVDSRTRRVEFIQSNYDELQGQLEAGRKAIAQTEGRLAAQKEKVDQMINAMLAKVDTAERKSAPVRSAPPVKKPPLPAPKPVAANTDAAKEADISKGAAEREVDPELLDYVKRERARMEKLLADGKEGKHTFRSLELKPAKGDPIPFEFLGHNQYRLVAPVEAGRQTYKINTWKFRRTIPADDDGERYVFIFDGRRLSRPRLVMYPEYVLPYLDK